MSTNRHMNNEIVVHMHNRVLVNHKKEWNPKFATYSEIIMKVVFIALSEMSHTQKHKYFIISYLCRVKYCIWYGFRIFIMGSCWGEVGKQVVTQIAVFPSFTWETRIDYMAWGPWAHLGKWISGQGRFLSISQNCIC